MSLEMGVQIATLISVIFAALSIWMWFRIYRRQTNTQVFIEFTNRYEKIMSSFPGNPTRLDAKNSPVESSKELSIACLRYLNLCSEEYYLWKKKYLAKDVWEIWEAEIKRVLCTPLFLTEWKKLEGEFECYGEFRTFVNSTQMNEASDEPKSTTKAH